MVYVPYSTQDGGFNTYYRDLLRQERASKVNGRNVAEKNSSKRSQHITTYVPDDPYDPGPYQNSEETLSKCDEDEDGNDPIKDTFNHFLARAKEQEGSTFARPIRSLQFLEE